MCWRPLLNRPAFGPYMVWMGGNRAYEPAALAVIAFAITWACMALIQLLTRFSETPESSNADGLSFTEGAAKVLWPNHGGASISTSISARVNSCRCSGLRAAARPRCCAWWRALKAQVPARSASTAADITGLRPSQRNIGLVFQSYALFPNLTVAENVAFGLKVAGVDKSSIDKRVGEMLAS